MIEIKIMRQDHNYVNLHINPDIPHSICQLLHEDYKTLNKKQKAFLFLRKSK